MLRSKYVVLSDYGDGKGGASIVAIREVEELKRFCSVAFLCVDKSIIRLVWLNLMVLILALMGKRFIVHTWSFFPCVRILVNAVPSRVMFVVHDYLLICPNKALYNFSSNQVCDLKGYSYGCLRTECGYSKANKLIHFASSRLSSISLKNCRIRFLSQRSKEIFHERVGEINSRVQPNYVMYDFHSLNNEREIITKHGLENKTYVIYIGRDKVDKGYDRFIDIKTSFVKVACGPVESFGSNTLTLGWLNETEVTVLAKNSHAIVYPSRQPDCDPLVQQLSEKFSIPFIVSAGNASSEYVKNRFGSSFVVTDWKRFDLDAVLQELPSVKRYNETRLFSVYDFYENAFAGHSD